MLVTNKVPNFKATAVLANNEIIEDFELYKNFGKNGTVVFFYPLDFKARNQRHRRLYRFPV